MPEHWQTHVRTVFHELLTNAFAHQDGTSNHFVQMHAYHGQHGILYNVEDGGRGFDVKANVQALYTNLEKRITGKRGQGLQRAHETSRGIVSYAGEPYGSSALFFYNFYPSSFFEHARHITRGIILDLELPNVQDNLHNKHTWISFDMQGQEYFTHPSILPDALRMARAYAGRGDEDAIAFLEHEKLC